MHWEVRKLGEICTYSKGKKPAVLKGAKTKDCSVPYINIKAFEKGIISEYTNGEKCNICNDEDLLMVWDGARCGLIGKAKMGAVGSTLMRILPKANIHKEYLYHFISSKFWELNSKPKGVGIPHIEPTLLWNFELIVPPLAEQQAIVAKIEELFSELENGKQQLLTAQQQLKVYRQSLLKWAFEGKLSSEWRKKQTKLQTSIQLLNHIRREKEDILLQKKIKVKTMQSISDEEFEELPKLPKGAAWVKLGEILWSVKDGPHYSPKYQENGIPFISGGNIRPNGIDFKNVKYISQDLHDELSRRCKPMKMDVLYTKGGTTGIAKVNDYDVDFNVWVHVAVLKAIPSINPFYLQHALNSNHCYKQSQKYTHGVGNQDLGLTRLVLITLPIYSIEEQNYIVSQLESKLTVCDKIEETISESLLQAEALKQSILKQAFEGKLVTAVAEQIEAKVIPLYKPKNEYFYQMQLLGWVAKASKQKQIEHGEMTLAKYAYLIDKVYDVPTYFNYNRWHLGPYPPTIKKAINNKQYFKKSGNHFEVLNEATLFNSTNPYTEKIRTAVNDLADIFSKYSTNDRSHKTELLATVCKVIEDIQSTDLKAIRQSMQEWHIDLKGEKLKTKAGKFNESETEKCLNFIKEKGWDKKLIK